MPRLSRSRLQVPTVMTTAITSPMIGSSRTQPVKWISRPAITTPSETPASAAMCRKAPRRFRSCSRPRMNSSAVTPFTTMAASATHIIVSPAT